MTSQVRREIRETGVFGKAIRFLFFAFNALMLVWLLSYWVTLSGLDVNTSAEKTGAAIGGTFGTLLLLFVWLAGAGILGALTLATRGPKLIVPIETPAGTTTNGWKTGATIVVVFAAAFFVAFALTGKSVPTIPALNKVETRAITSTPSTITPAPSASVAPVQSRTACKVSMAKYNSLGTGMAYPRIIAILGCEGTEMSRVEMAGQTAIMYSWEGNGFAANMNVMLQNGALVSKAQFGLR